MLDIAIVIFNSSKTFMVIVVKVQQMSADSVTAAKLSVTTPSTDH